MKKTFLILASTFALYGVVFAHLPRLEMTTNEVIQVQNPEISQAFYGNLHGQPDIYEIKMDTGFLLYVSIVVPDLSGQTTNFILDIGENDNAISTKIDGNKFTRTNFYEEFAGDAYLNGPSREKNEPAGSYTITVSNKTFQGKYSLAIGKKESFTVKETLHTLKVLPSLKMNFFDKSPFAIFQGLIVQILTGMIIVLALIIRGIVWIIKRKYRGQIKKNRRK